MPRKRKTSSGGRWITVAAILFVAAVVGAVILALSKTNHDSFSANSPGAKAAPPAGTVAESLPTENPATAKADPIPTMEINHAVMVTVELDFGSKVPSIAEALKFIERRQQPDDGRGRVFAILDAYGEPTSDGKKLHLSMHVSTEKPGLGSLVFRKTGEVLWQSRVVLGTNGTVFSGKNLTILLDDGHGRTVMVDGSGNPATLLNAHTRDTGMLVRDFWPDNAEREVTFIYSACGCPVKAMVRRIGERTVRTKELPVMFPDDPAAMVVISRLMGW